jgi:hypothetical protein
MQVLEPGRTQSGYSQYAEWKTRTYALGLPWVGLLLFRYNLHG